MGLSKVIRLKRKRARRVARWYGRAYGIKTSTGSAPVWVSRYSVTREYGGPEEGGWWWDLWEYRESYRAGSDSHAERMRARLEQTHGRPATGRGSMGRFSVNGGPDAVFLVETERGKHQTTERPHYE